MGYDRDDDYHRIEKRKEGKRRLQKTEKLIWAGFYSLFAFVVLYGFEKKGVDISGSIFFGVFSLKNGNVWSLSPYYLTLGLFALTYATLVPASKKSLIRSIELKSRRQNREYTIYEKAKIHFVDWVDKGIFWLLMPISALIFRGGVSKEESEVFYLRYGWLDHIENGFFKQTLAKVDGYERVRKLLIFKRYPEMLSGKRGTDAITSAQFSTILWMFKGRKELEDMLCISEGYIRLKGMEKYDRLLTKEEFNARMSLKQWNGDRRAALDSFRVYNGIDEIIFSEDIICELIDQEAKRFVSFIERFAFNARTLFSRRFQFYSSALYMDIKAPTYMFRNAEEAKKIFNDEKLFKKRLLLLLECYFRVVMLKIIINQYINLPAGTMVVKMRDYTLRMITETHDDESIIELLPGKNDGSNKGFESDNLVNLFLSTLHHYKNGAEESFEERIYKIFNLRDERVDAFVEESDIDEGTKMARVDMKAMEQGPDLAWLNKLKEDLGGVLPSHLEAQYESAKKREANTNTNA